jgi:hypothetical protein
MIDVVGPILLIALGVAIGFLIWYCPSNRK